MGVEITGSIRDIYRSFTRAEEAKGKGEETHHRIKSSLEKIDEWSIKLTTLRNVSLRNQLPNLALIGVDEVATYERVLARTR